jgi:hypothetical protein
MQNWWKASYLFEEARHEQKLLPSLFYIDIQQPAMIELLDLVDTPLVYLKETETHPSHKVLKK